MARFLVSSQLLKIITLTTRSIPWHCHNKMIWQWCWIFFPAHRCRIGLPSLPILDSRSCHCFIHFPASKLNFLSFQLTIAVLACLLFIASAIPMPFNAAALPGGWHYNGDVGRSWFLLLLMLCSWRLALHLWRLVILLLSSGKDARVCPLFFLLHILLLCFKIFLCQGPKLCHCWAHMAWSRQQGVHLRGEVEMAQAKTFWWK